MCRFCKGVHRYLYLLTFNMTLVGHRCKAPSSLTSCSGCGCCWLLPAIVRTIAGRHYGDFNAWFILIRFVFLEFVNEFPIPSIPTALIACQIWSVTSCFGLTMSQPKCIVGLVVDIDVPWLKVITVFKIIVVYHICVRCNLLWREIISY